MHKLCFRCEKDKKVKINEKVYGKPWLLNIETVLSAHFMCSIQQSLIFLMRKIFELYNSY